jgi:hypothetical protein
MRISEEPGRTLTPVRSIERIAPSFEAGRIRDLPRWDIVTSRRPESAIEDSRNHLVKAIPTSAS